MREIHTYVAYNDEEFLDRDECLAYEYKALSNLKEIAKAYTFFDEDMNCIFPPEISEDIEEWDSWLQNAFNDCLYVNRHKNLSDGAENFNLQRFGYTIINEDFNNELGLFKYDYDGWIKINLT